MPEITWWSDQPAGIPVYPQRSFSENILTPKDGSSFILQSLTNRSNQVNLRILRGQFVSFIRSCLRWNCVTSIERTPSSLMILFWYGGLARNFSRMKTFRYPVVPGGVCHKGIIFQGVMMPMGVLIKLNLWLRRKWGVMGASNNVPWQENIPYIYTSIWSVY